MKKHDLFWKKQFFNFFLYFFQRFRRSKFWFYESFENFLASMGLGKCCKKQSHEKWAHLDHPQKQHKRLFTWVGTMCPPSCRIGLKSIIIEFWPCMRKGVFVRTINEGFTCRKRQIFVYKIWRFRAYSHTPIFWLFWKRFSWKILKYCNLAKQSRPIFSYFSLFG